MAGALRLYRRWGNSRIDLHHCYRGLEPTSSIIVVLFRLLRLRFSRLLGYSKRCCAQQIWRAYISRGSPDHFLGIRVTVCGAGLIVLRIRGNIVQECRLTPQCSGRAASSRAAQELCGGPPLIENVSHHDPCRQDCLLAFPSS
jgi:hypothetical protein